MTEKRLKFRTRNDEWEIIDREVYLNGRYLNRGKIFFGEQPLSQETLSPENLAPSPEVGKYLVFFADQDKGGISCISTCITEITP